MIEQFIESLVAEFAQLKEVPLYVWLILPPILLFQGTWMFLDARKHDANPWFWGIWGMINTPTPLLLYLVFVRKIGFRKRRN